MTIHDQDDDRREAYRRLADPSIYRDGSPRPPADGTADRASGVPLDARPSDPGDPAAEQSPDPGPATSYDQAPYSPEDDEEYAEVRQRERFGGVNWGAGFYGWLVAVSMTVILVGVVAAAVGVLDRTVAAFPAPGELAPRVLAIAAAGTFVLVLMSAYFLGGYVAGRMSRFDGGRQGAAVWVTGVMLSMVVVGAGLLLGWQLDVLARVDLPSVPVPAEARGVAGVGAAVAALVGTLLAAIGGGKVGRGYHRKVDDYRYEAALDRW